MDVSNLIKISVDANVCKLVSTYQQQFRYLYTKEKFVIHENTSWPVTKKYIIKTTVINNVI